MDKFINYIVVFVVGVVIGFFWNINQVNKNKLKLIELSSEHSALKSENNDLKDANLDILNRSLSDLGFKDSEIIDLIQENESLLEKVKSKTIEYLPGKTKYIERTSCGNDYVGTDDSMKVNNAIKEGFNKRARNND